MRFRLFALLLAVPSVALACGGETKSDVAQTGAGGSSAAGAGGSSAGAAGTSSTAGLGGVGGGKAGSGTAGSGGCESFVPCCDDATGAQVEPKCGTGGPECPPGSSFPPSGTCTPTSACAPDQPCGPSAWCDYPDDLCGTGAKGVCKPKPTGCDLVYQPVCGCDGKVASSPCNASSQGIDLSAKAACTPPDKTFSCGPYFCDQAPYGYCEVTPLGGMAGGDKFVCKPTPANCPFEFSCGCLMKEPCGKTCSGDAKGNWTLVCPTP